MRKAVLAALLMSTLALGSCAKDEYIYVDKGWVRLPAVPGRPGAAYFTIHGGAQADTLIGVDSPVAIKTEIHDTVSEGGAMKMRPLPRVDVPAKGEVAFAPGGKHVMLFDLRSGLKAGDTVRLNFTFASGLQIYIDAPAQAAGDPAAEHAGH